MNERSKYADLMHEARKKARARAAPPARAASTPSHPHTGSPTQHARIAPRTGATHLHPRHHVRKHLQ